MTPASCGCRADPRRRAGVSLAVVRPAALALVAGLVAGRVRRRTSRGTPPADPGPPPGGERLERPARHHRHPARRPPVAPTGMGGTTSPHMDALARRGTLFEQAYTLLAEDPGQLRGHAHRQAALAHRLRQDPSPAPRPEPDPGQRAAGLRATRRRRSWTTPTSRPPSAMPRGSRATARPGRRRRSRPRWTAPAPSPRRGCRS